MDLMNREEIIELIESLKIDNNEFVVLSTGALTMRGIFEGAKDLDIAVTKKGLEELKNNFDVVIDHDDWYRVTDKVECILDDMENKKEKVGNYYLEDLNYYRNFLVNSDRPKDKIRLEIVNKALNK